MITEAETTHIIAIAKMLKSMTDEVFGAKASADLQVYITYVTDFMSTKDKWLFVDTELRGFFMVIDDTESITPDLHRYIGTKVYIKPEYRSGRLLAEFYDTLFSRFDDVVGVTEIGSQHIAVLDKRHELIAKVYRIKRS